MTFEEGPRLPEAAGSGSLPIGAVPDTFLGGGRQHVRVVIDGDLIGVLVGGAATFMNPGHERWHPNPGFHYQDGGGPMLDIGPYYVVALVNLFGPVPRSRPLRPSRGACPILSEPRRGEVIPVVVPTHVAGTPRSAVGALTQVNMSFDVAGHRHGRSISTAPKCSVPAFGGAG